MQIGSGDIDSYFSYEFCLVILFAVIHIKPS